MISITKKKRIFENKSTSKRINRSVFGTVVLALLLALFGFFMALPMVYVISNAFKPLEEIFLFPPRLLVQHPTLDNFKGMGDLISNMWISAPASRTLSAASICLMQLWKQIPLCRFAWSWACLSLWKLHRMPYLPELAILLSMMWKICAVL